MRLRQLAVPLLLAALAVPALAHQHARQVHVERAERRVIALAPGELAGLVHELEGTHAVALVAAHVLAAAAMICLENSLT